MRSHGLGKFAGVLILSLSLWAFLCAGVAGQLDLSKARIIYPPEWHGVKRKAVEVLVEEVEKRTGVRMSTNTGGNPHNMPVIQIASRPDRLNAELRTEAARAESGPGATEGFRIFVKDTRLTVVGNDERGVMFGVGKLLREMHMTRGRLWVDDTLAVCTAPKYGLRGHQLGYRPKCNSYDAWDLPVWDQYIRDLAVFGCNAIELIPPRSDDAKWSPHFKRPPMEMIAGMSRIADSYGMDVWLWYPAMDSHYTNSRAVAAALKEWGQVFAKLPRLDDVFVPGGDPGHTRPKVLMALLEKQTETLRRSHPKARMWMSPQGFNQEWLDEFIGILRQKNPAWLSGIVYGPQIRVSLAQLRERVPARYPIRDYPDITHNRQCQYPVPEWDTAYAVTEARECINPRPRDETAIFHATQTNTIGFITYSEGCNDDVNKFVWSGLGWDPEENVEEILRQYSRYFTGDIYAESFSQGLLALEQNWRGSLLRNQGVEQTLAAFQNLEKNALPEVKENWRFQQALFRAYYDASVRRRLIQENQLEEQAMERLRDAHGIGAKKAMAEAKKILRGADDFARKDLLRKRAFELGDDLFHSIGMQLSVKLYKASAVDRGASLDTIDFPLNNRCWLEEQFGEIARLKSESARLDRLEQIVNWTNPGRGGYYDDLGNPAAEPHLIRGAGFEADPGCYASARDGFGEEPFVNLPRGSLASSRRLSWLNHAEALYDASLRMVYTNLDANARYKLRVVYAGDNQRTIRLEANGKVQIHPYLTKPLPFKVLEFDLPPEATRSSRLELQWSGEEGLGGNGRSCQVSEVWLVEETSTNSTKMGLNGTRR